MGIKSVFLDITLRNMYNNDKDIPMHWGGGKKNCCFLKNDIITKGGW